jgi:hypothetical protein
MKMSYSDMYHSQERFWNFESTIMTLPLFLFSYVSLPPLSVLVFAHSLIMKKTDKGKLIFKHGYH